MNDAHPDLSSLVRGELGNVPALEVADHLRGCTACRDELVDVTLGHGLLTAAARTTGAGARVGSPATTAGTLPPQLVRGVRRGRRLALLVGAAGIVAAVALSAAWLLTRGAQDAAPRPVAAQTAPLSPVSGGPQAAHGRVSMATDPDLVTRMQVDTVDLPSAPRGGFYYVWLLDPATQKMLPLGQVTPGHRASFEIPESLVGAYSAVDISLESDDGDPAHSVTSVLRASYADPPGS